MFKKYVKNIYSNNIIQKKDINMFKKEPIESKLFKTIQTNQEIFVKYYIIYKGFLV